MRLLYLTRDSYPTFRVDIECLFGKYLSAMGVKATILAEGSISNHGSGRMDCIAIELSKYPKYVKAVVGSVRMLIEVLKRAGDYDAVQLRNLPILCAILLLGRRFVRRPIFYWMSFPYPEDDLLRVQEQGRAMGVARAGLTYLRGKLSKLLFYSVVVPRVDHLFVQSEQMKRDVLSMVDIDPAKISAVPMGFDPEELATSADSQNDSRKKIVGYFGAMDRTRELDFVLRVFSRVLEKCPMAGLYFVGGSVEPGDEKWLRDEAERYGLAEHVVITGWLAREQAWAVLRQLTVAVCPLPDKFVFKSMSPTKAVELLALGIPIVTNEHPDQGELVRRGKYGLVVPYEEQPFADAISFLLEDSETARNWGRAGREYVRSHRGYASLAFDVARTYSSLLPQIEVDEQARA